MNAMLCDVTPAAAVRSNVTQLCPLIDERETFLAPTNPEPNSKASKISDSLMPCNSEGIGSMTMAHAKFLRDAPKL